MSTPFLIQAGLAALLVVAEDYIAEKWGWWKKRKHRKAAIITLAVTLAIGVGCTTAAVICKLCEE